MNASCYYIFCEKCQFIASAYPLQMSRHCYISFYYIPNIQSNIYFFSDAPILRATCLMCLSTITFQDRDLPIEFGRIHVSEAMMGQVEIPLNDFKNFQIYNFIERSKDTIYPSLLKAYDDLMTNALDENVSLPEKIWPHHGYTDVIEFEILKPKTTPETFCYENDKAHNFIKYFSIENCPYSGHEHLIYQTFSDIYRYCNNCSFLIPNNVYHQTIRIREIIDSFIFPN